MKEKDEKKYSLEDEEELDVEFLIDEYYSSCRMCPFRGFCGT